MMINCPLWERIFQTPQNTRGIAYDGIATLIKSYDFKGF